MEEWIDADKELPPCDGFYEVTNNPESILYIETLSYDGIGFFYINSYRPVRYWRPIKPIHKKYGKIEG